MSECGDMAMFILRAGFRDDGAKTMIAHGICESGCVWNKEQIGGGGGWGYFQFDPSNSLYDQARGASPQRQADLAFIASGGGVNFRPWSATRTCAANSADRAQAAYDEAIKSLGPLEGGPVPGGIPDPADALDNLAQAIKAAIEGLLGTTVGEFIMRFLEIMAGAMLMGIALVMFIEIVSTPGTRQAGGIVSRSASKVTDVIPYGGVAKKAAGKVLPK